MELKRILARDSRTANEKAIQLYGKDVLVISNQKVDGQIELVVAVDAAPQEEPKADQPRPAQPQEHVVPVAGGFGKFFQEAQLEPLPDEPPADLSLRNLKNSLAHVDLTDSFERKRGQEIVELLRSEIATLRDELLLSVRGRMSVGASPLSGDAQALMGALAEAGMPVSMQLLLESELLKAGSAEEASSITSAALMKTMKRRPSMAPDTGRHALIGPSGAGKTLMTARLAHMAAALHGDQQQVLISFNDTRPGAWAQIQVLASQIGADCFRAQDLQALKAVLDDLGPRRSVWIDTGSVDFMATARELGALGLQIHAVLPVDATATHVRKTMSDKTVKLASLMLSKADDATASWALIKGLCETDLPVSAVADTTSISRATLQYDPRLLIDAALGAAGLQDAPRIVKKPRAKATPASVGKRQASPSRRTRVASIKAAHG